MTQFTEGEDLIDFTEYQNFTETTDIVRDRVDGLQHVQYLALGLAGEAGEVAGKVKKLVRDGNGNISARDEEAIADELGDVLWYLARMASVLAYPLDVVALNNQRKLESRQARGVIGGSGDNR